MSEATQNMLNEPGMITVVIRTEYVESTHHAANNHKSEFSATIDAVRHALRGVGYAEETINSCIKEIE